MARAGVKKLVLLNSHGGQVGVMDIVARDLRARLGMLVYSVNWFNLPLGRARSKASSAPRNTASASMPARSRPP